jgi:hypothetical protein
MRKLGDPGHELEKTQRSGPRARENSTKWHAVRPDTRENSTIRAASTRKLDDLGRTREKTQPNGPLCGQMHEKTRRSLAGGSPFRCSWDLFWDLIQSGRVAQKLVSANCSDQGHDNEPSMQSKGCPTSWPTRDPPLEASYYCSTSFLGVANCSRRFTWGRLPSVGTSTRYVLNLSVDSSKKTW